MKAQGDEMTATGGEHADCADGPGAGDNALTLTFARNF